MSFDPVVYSALVKRYKETIGTFKTEHIRKKKTDSVTCDGSVIDLYKYPLLKEKIKSAEGPGFVIPITDFIGAARKPLTGSVALSEVPTSTGMYIGAVDNIIFAIDPTQIRNNNISTIAEYNSVGSNFRVLKRTPYTTYKIDLVQHVGGDKYLFKFSNSAAIAVVALLDVATGAYVEKDLAMGLAWNRSGIISYVIGNKLVCGFGINVGSISDAIKTYDFSLGSEALVTTGLPTLYNLAGANNLNGLLQLIVHNRTTGLYEVYESNAAVTAFNKITTLTIPVGALAASCFDWININKSTLFFTSLGSIMEFNFVTKEFKEIVNNRRRRPPSAVNSATMRFAGIINSKIMITNYSSTSFNTPEFNAADNRKRHMLGIKFSITGDTIRFDSLRPEHQEPYAINYMVQTPTGVVLRALQNGMLGVNNPRYYKLPKIGSSNSSTEVRLITGPRKE